MSFDVHDCPYIFRVYFNASLRNYESQKLSRRNPEDALQRVQLHLVSAQIGECFTQIIKEGALLPGYDGNVVHVSVDVTAILFVKTSLHATLVRGSCVLQPKGHGYVAIRAIWRDERGFDLIRLSHTYLVVARIGV